MSWFAILLMAIAVGFVATNGGRAQLLVARLASQIGRSQGLLVCALASSTVTMAMAAWLGSMAGADIGPGALGWVSSAALLGAAVELLWPVRMRVAQEPTRSLGAISLVLLARQIADAPRLIIFAAAAQIGSNIVLGSGGIIGAGFCLWVGWHYGDVAEHRFPAIVSRWMMGLALLVLAILLGAEAAGFNP